MHSGASVAQPCLACGAGRETRTPTPKRWYLKPMRLPIPPYPHVGRRYVTMFRKGQARRSPRPSFPPDFSCRLRRREEAAALFDYLQPAPGEKAQQRNRDYFLRKRKAAQPAPRLSCPANPHGGRRGKRRYLCGYDDIIYSTSRTAHCARPFLICNSRLPRPPLARSTLADSQCRSSRHHQKHTNWSQIMHESPQSARFTGLHCIPRIGGILLCLFFF